MNSTVRTLLGAAALLGLGAAALYAKKAAERMVDDVSKEALKTAFDRSFTEALNRTNQTKEQQ